MSVRCKLPVTKWLKKVTGKTQEDLFVTSELDKEDVIRKLTLLKQKGIKSVAVVLLHSYT